MHWLLGMRVHCIQPESFRVILQASVRDTRLAHAVKRSVVVMQAVHRLHTANKASMHPPRNSTDIITMPFSIFAFTHSLSTLRITNLELAGKATCARLQPGVSSSDRGTAIWPHLPPPIKLDFKYYNTWNLSAGPNEG
jgi:hypothetical protein